MATSTSPTSVVVGQVDDLLVQRLARALPVQVVHEVDDAAVVLEAGLEALAALVGEGDPQALREERHLAEALGERVALVVDRLEDLEVGQELDAGAAAIGLGALLQLALRRAPLVGLRPLVAVTPDRELELLGQGVDHRHAHAVKAARHLVPAAVAELAAGVQHREHDLGRRALLLLVHAHGNAAAVVGDRDGVVGVDRDLDVIALAGECLVDGVVHDLVDEVMQAAHACRADVHAGPLAHRLQALEDRDVLRAVRGGVLLRVLLRQAFPSVGLHTQRGPGPELSALGSGRSKLRLRTLAE